MTRVVFIGLKPEAVDYDDPDLPPGVDEATIRKGIANAMQDFADRGWDGVECMVSPDTALAGVEAALADGPVDCVVIGGGLRMPAKRLELFEAVLNAVHRSAPGAAIAFNTRPDDSAAAVARWVG